MTSDLRAEPRVYLLLPYEILYSSISKHHLSSNYNYFRQFHMNLFGAHSADLVRAGATL